MTTLQRIVKYCAVAFALFLIVSIIGGSVQAIASVSRIFDHDDVVGKAETYAVDGEIENMDIEISGAELEIRTGSDFSVQSNHKYLETENKNGVFCVKERRSSLNFGTNDVRVIITVPEDVVFDKISVSTGAGVVKIDSLIAEDLSLELGVGEVRIDEIIVDGKAKIHCGAGELTVDGGRMKDLDMELGIGEVTLKNRLTGDCRIDCGAGELDLTLFGSAEDYRITLDKGVGETSLAGKKMLDGETYGSGGASIKLNGGVGEILIDFDEWKTDDAEKKEKI